MIFSYSKCDNDSYDVFRFQVIDLARNGKEVSEPINIEITINIR